MIQSVISRMGQNSFNTKTWSVTLLAAVLAFADPSAGSTLLLAIAPAIAFWALDVFFLRQERLFRALYKAAADGKIAAFSMETRTFQEQVDRWHKLARSNTVWPIHGLAALGIAAKAFLLQ